MSQVYTSIISLLLLIHFCLDPLIYLYFKTCITMRNLVWCKAMFRPFSFYLFIYLFIYFYYLLINLIFVYWLIYSTNKTGFRIFSNTFRSISSPIDNFFCSRCWLAKRFKTLSDKLMLIEQKRFRKEKLRLIGNSFCHFTG